MSSVVGTIVGVALAVWTQWVAVVAFIGGWIPLTPWRFHGVNVGRGIVYLLFGEPALFFVLSVGAAAIAAVVGKTRAGTKPTR